MWAFGCVIYELATKRKAFKSDWAVRDYYYSQNRLCIDLERFISSKNRAYLTRTIEAMLAIEVSQRPSAAELQDLFSFLSSLQSSSRTIGDTLVNKVLGVDLYPMLSLEQLLGQQSLARDGSTSQSSCQSVINCNDPVSEIQISDDLVATAIEGSSVVGLWEVDGRPRYALLAHQGPVCALALEMNTLLSGGEDGHVVGWDCDTGRIKYSLETDKVTALALCQRSHLLAYGNQNRDIFLKSHFMEGLIPGKEGDGIWLESRWLSRHESHIKTLKFHPLGKQLLSSAAEGVVVWNLEDGSPVSQILRGYTWLGDCKADLSLNQWLVLLSNTADHGAVRVWNTATGSFAETEFPEVQIQHWNYTPCGRYTMVLDVQGNLSVWEQGGKKLIHTLRESYKDRVSRQSHNTGLKTESPFEAEPWIGTPNAYGRMGRRRCYRCRQRRQKVRSALN